MKALVTGASSGIGQACVVELREAGFEVIEWDLSNEHPVDVSSTSDVTRAAGGLTSPLDAIVLAAGVARMSPLIETTDDAWNFQMNVNAFGVFNCLRSLVPHTARGGSIAIIDSMGGLRGAPFLSAYCASKFAVTGLIESATPELAVRGIRINGVCPMYVRTPMQQRDLQEESALRGMTMEQVFAEYESTTPLGRVAEPSEVASVVRFLVTEPSGYMTGTMVPVSGGAHLGFTV